MNDDWEGYDCGYGYEEDYEDNPWLAPAYKDRIAVGDAGHDFLRWLAAGLTHQTLACNRRAARVHGVPGGVLIASPRIFKDYQADTGVPWASAQKAFQKCRLHTKRDDGTNIWTYRVTGGRKRGGPLRGFLIENPTALGLPEIAVNPHLVPAGVGRPNQ